MTEDQAEPVGGEEARKVWERPELSVLEAGDAEAMFDLGRHLLAS